MLGKNSYIFSKQSFSYISGNGNSKKIIIFQETETLRNFLEFLIFLPKKSGINFSENIFG